MHKFQRFLPFLRWFPMSWNTVRADLIAGITVALVLIPQSMTYAQLAGLPAYYGLYAAFLPVMVAALWGSSNQLCTGPVAIVSLLTATSIANFVPAIGSPEFINLAIMLAFLVGTFQLLLGIFRLGVIVNFLSHAIIIGFTNAAALIIAFSQLNKMLGVSLHRSENFLIDIWNVFLQIGNTHIPTLLFGLTALTIMWFLKHKHPKIPNVLIAVAVTILVSWLINFQGMGGQIVGEIPKGLPSFIIPTFNMTIFWEMVISSIVIALIGFMEAISIAKAMAIKTKEHIDSNQELIGQGLANIIGSMTQAYPTSGSFSRSAVNLNANAKTGMSSVYTAIIVMITLLFLTPLLYHLPNAVLAAVIMIAVFGLINFKAIKHSWHISKHDGATAIVTFVATLGTAPHLEQGILIGFGYYLIFLPRNILK